MKEWSQILAAFLVVFYVIHCINTVGITLQAHIAGLHEKIDATLEKIDEIQSDIELAKINKDYVNPIDL